MAVLPAPLIFVFLGIRNALADGSELFSDPGCAVARQVLVVTCLWLLTVGLVAVRQKGLAVPGSTVAASVATWLGVEVFQRYVDIAWWDTGPLEFDLALPFARVPVAVALIGVATACRAACRIHGPRRWASDLVALAAVIGAILTLMVPSRFPAVWQLGQLSGVRSLQALESGGALLTGGALAGFPDAWFGQIALRVLEPGTPLRAVSTRPVISCEASPQGDRVLVVQLRPWWCFGRDRFYSVNIVKADTLERQVVAEDTDVTSGAIDWMRWTAVGPGAAWAVLRARAHTASVLEGMLADGARLLLPIEVPVEPWSVEEGVVLLSSRRDPCASWVTRVSWATGEVIVEEIAAPGACMPAMVGVPRVAPDRRSVLLRGQDPNHSESEALLWHKLGGATETVASFDGRRVWVLWRGDGTPNLLDQKRVGALLLAAGLPPELDHARELGGQVVLLTSGPRSLAVSDLDLATVNVVASEIDAVDWLSDSVVFVHGKGLERRIERYWPGTRVRQTLFDAAQPPVS